MIHKILKKFITLNLIILWSSFIFSQSRLKDLISVKGVRENPVIGYGLVIGLNGTGDGGNEIVNTSLLRMFQKLGLNPQKEVSSKNVAAVIVTAKLPPFARVGQKIDVTVSSINDAGSLAGGTLLVTPLKGGNSQIYAVAQGPLTIGGPIKGKQFATTGKIPNGATVEKEIETNFDLKESLRFSLNNPDFTTAHRIEKTINQELGGKFAIAKDSTTIDLLIPNIYQKKIVELIALIENFKVFQDQKAKIVINERTGTIIAGGDIALRPVAIGHGDLTIEIKAVEGEDNGQQKKKDRLLNIKQSTLNDLVKALNTLGATPDDLMSIISALKSNGALVGDIEFI